MRGRTVRQPAGAQARVLQLDQVRGDRSGRRSAGVSDQRGTRAPAAGHRGGGPLGAVGHGRSITGAGAAGLRRPAAGGTSHVGARDRRAGASARARVAPCASRDQTPRARSPAGRAPCRRGARRPSSTRPARLYSPGPTARRTACARRTTVPAALSCQPRCAGVRSHAPEATTTHCADAADERPEADHELAHQDGEQTGRATGRAPTACGCRGSRSPTVAPVRASAIHWPTPTASPRTSGSRSDRAARGRGASGGDDGVPDADRHQRDAGGRARTRRPACRRGRRSRERRRTTRSGAVARRADGTGAADSFLAVLTGSSVSGPPACRASWCQIVERYRARVHPTGFGQDARSTRASANETSASLTGPAGSGSSSRTAAWASATARCARLLDHGVHPQRGDRARPGRRRPTGHRRAGATSWRSSRRGRPGGGAGAQQQRRHRRHALAQVGAGGLAGHVAVGRQVDDVVGQLERDADLLAEAASRWRRRPAGSPRTSRRTGPTSR